MTQVWISAVGLCGASIIGSAIGFFIKELPHKWNDTLLGYCAGLMLAASTLGLIVPAFEQAQQWWWAVGGVMAGALFLNGCTFDERLRSRPCAPLWLYRLVYVP